MTALAGYADAEAEPRVNWTTGLPEASDTRGGAPVLANVMPFVGTQAPWRCP